MSKERKLKIQKLIRDVRKKYIALKLGRTEEDETIQRLFTPITKRLYSIKDEQVAAMVQQATLRLRKSKFPSHPLQSAYTPPPKALKPLYSLFPTGVSSSGTASVHKQLVNDESSDDEVLYDNVARLPTTPFQRPTLFPKPTPPGIFVSTPLKSSRQKNEVDFLSTIDVAKRESMNEDDDDDDIDDNRSLEDEKSHQELCCSRSVL
ncbi:hypothetical protein HHI36_008063 [Cryptolaemus montrouzieri]|uniref:Uncharacterized protein n=1 Tax=Cryptolaemus montrouzieri TaxID=559131 RepID=A0ABD2MRX5_9CUCU